MPARHRITTVLPLLPAAWAATAISLLALPALAEGSKWRSPVESPSVVGRFSFDGQRPYRAGQRRVAGLVGRPGEAVRAPCSGVVTFAGPLPRGSGVTIRCGHLAATLTGIAAASARRGAAVTAGEAVGRLGETGTVRLGARRAGRRHGYVDPLELIGEGSGGPAPLAPPARRTRPPRAPERQPVARDRKTVGPTVVMAAAWLGLGIAGSALGIGVALKRPSVARVPAARARPAGR